MTVVPPTRLDGLVCVTVAAEGRRVDVALPASVPVAELLPELARSLGVAPGVPPGLVTASGRPVRDTVGLAHQDVADGAVLALVTHGPVPPPRVHDDLAEAVAEAVRRDRRAWRPATGRRTAGAAAGLLQVLGAATLLQLGGTAAAVGGAVVGAVALAAGVSMSRLWGERLAAVGCCWAAAAHAAVAGHALGASSGASLAAAGAGASVAGLVALAGLVAGRALALAPVLVGLVLLAAGLLSEVADLDPRVVLTAAQGLLVVAAGGFPSVALATSRLAVPRPGDEPATVPPGPGEVAAAVRRAHETLLGLGIGAGALLVGTAPLAVELGVAGALVALTCCLVVVLRTRHHRDGDQVLGGLVAGLGGLVSVVVSALLLHPDWRPALAATLPGAGAVLLWLAVAPPRPSPRHQRWGDLVETAAMVCLPPLLLVATGTLAVVGG